MTGRKPRPSALKAAEGDRGKRGIRPTVEAPEGDFDPPFRLTGVARKEWIRIRREAHWIRAADSAALADRCQCYAQLLEAEIDISKRGTIIRTRNGKVSNPSVRIARQYRAAIQRHDAELGLTPSARERISDTEPRDEATDAVTESFYGPHRGLERV